MFDRAFIRASSVNRALDVIGDRWLIMILQQAWFGVRRFDDFQRRLGIARSTLTSRLKHLVEHGVLQRHAYNDHPLRYDYRLTNKGLGLFPAALMAQVWQQRWAPPPDMPALKMRHHGCGALMVPQMVCGHCTGLVDVREVRYARGPGAGAEPLTEKRRRRSSVEGPPPTRTPVSLELLEILGDRWTPQVAATAFFGLRRFEDMREALQMAPNILADRLRRLVELGVFVTEPYQDRPVRMHYRLTDKGRDIYPLLLALMNWGDRWYGEAEGPPLLLTHGACGQSLHARVVCGECGEALDAHGVAPVLQRHAHRVARRQQK
ncbi:MAG: helix-turn-helix transcriptional regulator [Gammaproteobacteria bacterium]|nr:helix-turn-helix transcriptional regulator [Gammaproteobacteria bacterium]